MEDKNIRTYRITTEKRGNPPIEITTIDERDEASVPEGAVSLDELREAAEARAEEVRRFRDGSLAGTLLVPESLTVANVDIGNLTRSLPSGSVVYEAIQIGEQNLS